MVRPSLVTSLAVLLVATVGLMAVAAVRRAQADRRPAEPRAAAPAPAAPPATERIPAAGRPLRSLPAVERRSTAPPPPKPNGILRVRPGRSVALRSKPRGRVLTSVGSTTQFGSPTTLAVAAERGGWLGVTSTDLPNGEIGWVKARNDSFERDETRLAIRIDLSRRRMKLMAGRRVLERATVGIGRPGSTTPTGRFAITDKLPGARYSSFYGCCILALSGHQTNTPPGWRGGDRLAIHGTSNPATIGTQASAGCLHAGAQVLQMMMRRVPLGTPVFIRA